MSCICSTAHLILRIKSVHFLQNIPVYTSYVVKMLFNDCTLFSFSLKYNMDTDIFNYFFVCLVRILHSVVSEIMHSRG